jgi:two-component system cell cycle sensor histidine kinase/response regulator CckA
MPRTRSLLNVLAQTVLIQGAQLARAPWFYQSAHIGRSAPITNRIASAPTAPSTQRDANLTSEDPIASISVSNGLITGFVVVLVFGAMTLAFLSAEAAEPVVLTVMGVLSMLGVFFIFGMTAGHIRIAERNEETDIILSVAERLDDGIFLTTPDSQVLFGNRAAGRLLGRDGLGDLNSLEEAVAASPGGAEGLFRLCRAAANGQVRTEDVEIVRDQGTLAGSSSRWLRITVKPFGHVDLARTSGNAILWSLSDITGNRAREAADRRHLERRLTYLEQIPAGVLIAGADGRIDFINENLCRDLGFDAEDHEQDLILTNIAAGDGAQLLHALERDETGMPPRIELDLVRKDGTRWPATLIVEPKSIANSPLGASRRGFSAIVLERPPQPNNTDQDALSHVHFENFFQSAPFGIATLSAAGAITGANGAFARMVLDGKKVVDRNAFDMLSGNENEETAAELRSAFDAAFAGKANIPPFEISVGENAEFTRRLFLTSLSTSDDADRAVVLYVTDASDEKALERKFAQAQKMEAVGKLAGGIAHDFNNMLTAIIGFSDLLMLSHRPGDHAYKNIQNIRSSANRASELVKKLLAFSRRQTLEPVILQLNEMMTDLSVILNRLLGEQIELKISSGRDLWAVKADRSQIDQVVINLAVNARDALPDGGRLAIRTRNIPERDSQRYQALGMDIGEYVLIEVEDNGTGMSEEVRSKIFEPFFTTKDIGKGTGLGLATVYGIVKQTGGYIFADSTPGKGTTFRVFLPRFHEAEGAAVAKVELAPPPRPRDLTGNGRVLVVEDEDAVRIFATEALKRQGYEVLQACDGVEALEIMEENDYKVDIVVSDVKMPEMDGPTLYKELRAKCPDLKFIFVSGYADDAFNHVLEPDADYVFLPKPYTLAQIAETVKEHIT